MCIDTDKQIHVIIHPAHAHVHMHIRTICTFLCMYAYMYMYAHVRIDINVHYLTHRRTAGECRKNVKGTGGIDRVVM